MKHKDKRHQIRDCLNLFVSSKFEQKQAFPHLTTPAKNHVDGRK